MLQGYTEPETREQISDAARWMGLNESGALEVVQRAELRKSMMAAKRGEKSSKPVVEPVAGPPTRPGQPGGKRDQVRRARTEQLCGAALHLFLEQGLETTTIDEITQEAGVSKGSFYRYFKDKEALVRHLFAPLHQEVDDAMRTCTQSIRGAPDAAQAYVAYVQVGVALAGILSRHRSVLLLYLRESRSAAIGSRRPIAELGAIINQHAVEMTDVAHEQKVLRPFPHKLSALAVVGASEKILLTLLEGEELGELFELPSLLTSMVMDGLRPRDPR